MSQRRQKKNKLPTSDLPVPEYRTRSGRRVKKPERWNPTETPTEVARDLNEELSSFESTRRNLKYDEKKIDDENPEVNHVPEKLNEKSSDSSKNAEELLESIAVDSLSESVPNSVINPKINVVQSVSKINVLKNGCDSFEDSLNEPLPNKKKLSTSNLTCDSKSNRKSLEKPLLSASNFYDSLEDICSLASNVERISGSEKLSDKSSDPCKNIEALSESIAVDSLSEPIPNPAISPITQNNKNTISEKSLAIDDSLMIDACPKGLESDNGEQHFEEDSLAIIEYEKAFDDSLEEAELIEMLNVSHPEEKVIESVEFAETNTVEQSENNTSVTRNLFQTTVELQVDRNSLNSSAGEKITASQSEKDYSVSVSDCFVSKDSLETSLNGISTSNIIAQCEQSRENETSKMNVKDGIISDDMKNISTELLTNDVSHPEHNCCASISMPDKDVSNDNLLFLDCSKALSPFQQQSDVAIVSHTSNECVFTNRSSLDSNNIIPSLLVASCEDEHQIVCFNGKSLSNSDDRGDILFAPSEPNNSNGAFQETHVLNRPCVCYKNINDGNKDFDDYKNDTGNLSSDNIEKNCLEQHNNEHYVLENHNYSTKREKNFQSVSESHTPRTSLNLSLENSSKDCHSSKNVSVNNDPIISLDEDIVDPIVESPNLSCEKTHFELFNSPDRKEMIDVDNKNCCTTYFKSEPANKSVPEISVSKSNNFQTGLIISETEDVKNLDFVSSDHLCSVSPSTKSCCEKNIKASKSEYLEILPEPTNQHKMTPLKAEYPSENISNGEDNLLVLETGSQQKDQQNSKEMTNSVISEKLGDSKEKKGYSPENALCSTIYSSEECRKLSLETCAEELNEVIEKVSNVHSKEIKSAKLSMSPLSHAKLDGSADSFNNSRRKTWNSHGSKSLTEGNNVLYKSQEDIDKAIALNNSNNDSIHVFEDVHVTARTKNLNTSQDISPVKRPSFNDFDLIEYSTNIDVDERVNEISDEARIVPNKSVCMDESILIVHESIVKTELNAEKTNEALPNTKNTSVANETIWIDDSMYLLPESNIKTELAEECDRRLTMEKDSDVLNNTICIDDSICIPEEINIAKRKIKKENLDNNIQLSQDIPIVEDLIQGNDTICVDETMCFPMISNNIVLENQNSDDDDTYYSCSSEIDSEKLKQGHNFPEKAFDHSNKAFIVDQNDYAMLSDIKKQIKKKALEVADSKSNDGSLVKVAIKVAVCADQFNTLSILPTEDEFQKPHNLKDSSDMMTKPTNSLTQIKNEVVDNFCSPKKIVKSLISSTKHNNNHSSLPKNVCADVLNFKSELNSEEPKLIEALDLHDISISYSDDRVLDSRDSIKPLNLCLQGKFVEPKNVFKSKDDKENVPVSKTVSSAKNLMNLPFGCAKKYASPQTEHYRSPKVLGSGPESKKSATKIPVRKMDNTPLSPIYLKSAKSDFGNEACEELKQPLTDSVGTVPLFRGKLFTPTIGDKLKVSEVTPAKTHHFCTVRNSISRVPKAPKSCPKKFQYIQSPIAQYIRSNRVLSPLQVANQCENVFRTPNSALPSHSTKIPGITQVTSQKLHLQKVNKKL